MEQSKQEKEIYELAELLMQSENIEASAIILRDFAEKCYQEGAVDAAKKEIAKLKAELKQSKAEAWDEGRDSTFRSDTQNPENPYKEE